MSGLENISKRWETLISPTYMLQGQTDGAQVYTVAHLQRHTPIAVPQL